MTTHFTGTMHVRVSLKQPFLPSNTHSFTRSCILKELKLASYSLVLRKELMTKKKIDLQLSSHFSSGEERGWNTETTVREN